MDDGDVAFLNIDFPSYLGYPFYYARRGRLIFLYRCAELSHLDTIRDLLGLFHLNIWGGGWSGLFWHFRRFGSNFADVSAPTPREIFRLLIPHKQPYSWNFSKSLHPLNLLLTKTNCHSPLLTLLTFSFFSAQSLTQKNIPHLFLIMFIP